MTANWKSRAETMLSQFIDGEFQDPYFHSRPPEHWDDNSSTSAPLPADGADDSVYDRLRGCGPRSCAAAGRGAAPCVSLFLRWVRFAFGSATQAYLSRPLCLALLPLAVGAGVGFWAGRRGRAAAAPAAPAAGGGPATGARGPARRSPAARVRQWLWLRLAAALVGADPRRGPTGTGGPLFQKERDAATREELEAIETTRESGVARHRVPRHIAVIMDGNRRYGRAKYGNAARGHWDGSKTLLAFAKWCIAEGVEVLTLYAFSTENWEREPAEVAALMAIFCKYCEELRVEAVQRGIRIHVLSTERERIPEDVRRGLERMVAETRHCEAFTMNICLSYSGRGEIVDACRSVAHDVRSGRLAPDRVDAAALGRRMLTAHVPDPDVLLRTSGEERLSDFLLWQVAYAELFFLRKHWPELEKEDLLEVIRAYAHGRQRRYGK